MRWARLSRVGVCVCTYAHSNKLSLKLPLSEFVHLNDCNDEMQI